MSPRALTCAVVLVAGLLACAAAGTAPAAGGTVAGTGIELVDGAGRAVLNLKGALLGGIRRGQVTITDLADREGTEIIVHGYEWMDEIDERTTTYGGADIRFRVFRGAWRVKILGGGIRASAVGKGIVGLKGRGRYSVAGGPYLPWPAKYQTIRLGD